MKLRLIANYAPDRQQSMLRFGDMLAERFGARGVAVDAVRPRVVLGRWARGAGGMAKWLGYADKYLLFPRELPRLVRGADIVHVIDHSNALYVPRQSSGAPWVATCHDLLAVRGALGEDTDCPASALGQRLQRAILAGLARAAAVGCDSTSTFADLARLAPAGPEAGARRRVILLGLNHSYRRVERAEAEARLAAADGGVPWGEPFLLHVGSNLARKNKAGILRVLGRVRERWGGNLVFAGAPLTPELRALARAQGVESRVFALEAPSDAELEAAYSRAHALIYPSKCEGFGWPVIEAQACGCPTICSDRTSLPEVAGEGGLVFALEDEAGMAEAVLRLDESDFRAGVVQRGWANLGRFSAERMIDAYSELYSAARAVARLP